MSLELKSSHRSFGGWTKHYLHSSKILNNDIRFAIYLPPQTSDGQKVPVLYWLSGLTCTDENFIQKSGVQRLASELGIAVVAPDTSPRGKDIPDQDSYDLGQGAGFYVNATEHPWSQHYRMYDYVLNELPTLIEETFPVNDIRSISGHSMGGHGALVLALRNPNRYRSVSAFSPICNPVSAPWGQKAFNAYLGPDMPDWAQYDASLLMLHTEHQIPALVDQGMADEFLEHQLKPETLKSAANASNYPLTLNYREGYDHSYFFIASFMDDHIKFHANYLNAL